MSIIPFNHILEIPIILDIDKKAIEYKVKTSIDGDVYQDMKNRFLEELKEILSDYEIEVLIKGKAA